MPAKILSMTDRRTWTPSEAMQPPPEPASVPTPIAVFSGYLVSPGNVDGWIAAWGDLADAASTWPGCRSFRLVRDQYDEMYVATLSEWDSEDAYRAFMQGTRPARLRGSTGFDVIPGESRVLDLIPAGNALQAAR